MNYLDKINTDLLLEGNMEYIIKRRFKDNVICLILPSKMFTISYHHKFYYKWHFIYKFIDITQSLPLYRSSLLSPLSTSPPSTLKWPSVPDLIFIHFQYVCLPYNICYGSSVCRFQHFILLFFHFTLCVLVSVCVFVLVWVFCVCVLYFLFSFLFSIYHEMDAVLHSIAKVLPVNTLTSFVCPVILVNRFLLCFILECYLHARCSCCCCWCCIADERYGFGRLYGKATCCVNCNFSVDCNISTVMVCGHHFHTHRDIGIHSLTSQRRVPHLKSILVLKYPCWYWEVL